MRDYSDDGPDAVDLTGVFCNSDVDDLTGQAAHLCESASEQLGRKRGEKPPAATKTLEQGETP